MLEARSQWSTEREFYGVSILESLGKSYELAILDEVAVRCSFTTHHLSPLLGSMT